VNSGFTTLGLGLKAEREKTSRARKFKGKKDSDFRPDALHDELEGLHAARFTNWVQARSASSVYKGKAVTAKSERGR
jgi:hypothetical protein